MLLNKLQEDGVALCRKGRLKEAAHRFSYALRKLPTGDQGEHTQTFTHLRLHLTLNLSRCKRKMNVSECCVINFCAVASLGNNGI